MAGSSASIRGHSAEGRQFTTLGTTCRCSPASQARFAQGQLRGAPFKDWILPASLNKVRQKLGKSDDADRQMVKILTTVLTDGLPAVEAACGEALDSGVHSADVVLNILARQREIIQPLTIATPLNATVVPRSAWRPLSSASMLIGGGAPIREHVVGDLLTAEISEK